MSWTLDSTIVKVKLEHPEHTQLSQELVVIKSGKTKLEKYLSQFEDKQMNLELSGVGEDDDDLQEITTSL